MCALISSGESGLYESLYGKTPMKEQRIAKKLLLEPKRNVKKLLASRPKKMLPTPKPELRKKKRSVSLLLNNDVDAGNVTIPANQNIPAVGMIVECRYLYAFKESGCIYQPVYLGVRDDIPADECTVDQLKYKAT